MDIALSLSLSLSLSLELFLSNIYFNDRNVSFIFARKINYISVLFVIILINIYLFNINNSALNSYKL
jgi:hypothetical protein